MAGNGNGLGITEPDSYETMPDTADSGAIDFDIANTSIVRFNIPSRRRVAIESPDSRVTLVQSNVGSRVSKVIAISSWRVSKFMTIIPTQARFLAIYSENTSPARLTLP